MRHVTQVVGCAFKLKRVDSIHGFDQVDAFVDLPHGAFDLRMPGVADHDDASAFFAPATDFAVHLGDERAGGVENTKAARLSFLRNGKRHAMRGKDERRAFGHLGEVVNENGATLAQIVDHGAVVHDLVADVDGGAVNGERAFDDRNGARDARAKAARLCEKDLHGQTFCRDLEEKRASHRLPRVRQSL